LIHAANNLKKYKTRNGIIHGNSELNKEIDKTLRVDEKNSRLITENDCNGPPLTIQE
jgi:hypothetical protein